MLPPDYKQTAFPRKRLIPLIGVLVATNLTLLAWKCGLRFFVPIKFQCEEQPYPQALLKAREAVRADPQNTFKRILLVSYLEMKSTREAQEEVLHHLKECVKLAPDDPDVHSRLGDYAYAQGHIAESIRHYQKALSLDSPLHPTNPGVLTSLGQCYQAQRQYAKAVQLHRAAIAACPEFPVPYLYLGDAYRGLGDIKSARSAWKRCIELCDANISDEMKATRMQSRAELVIYGKVSDEISGKDVGKVLDEGAEAFLRLAKTREGS